MEKLPSNFNKATLIQRTCSLIKPIHINTSLHNAKVLSSGKLQIWRTKARCVKTSQKASIVYRNGLVRGVLLLVLRSIITRDKVSGLKHCHKSTGIILSLATKKDVK